MAWQRGEKLLHPQYIVTSTADSRRFGAWLVDLADKIHLHLIAARASGMAGSAAFHGDNLWFLWTLQLCD